MLTEYQVISFLCPCLGSCLHTVDELSVEWSENGALSSDKYNS